MIVYYPFIATRRADMNLTLRIQDARASIQYLAARIWRSVPCLSVLVPLDTLCVEDYHPLTRHALA